METLMRNRAARQPDELPGGGRSAAPWRSLHDDCAPIMRPGLEYQHAFDYCAVEAHRYGGPLIVAAGSTFYASQLLGRLVACEPQLIGADGADTPRASVENPRSHTKTHEEDAHVGVAPDERRTTEDECGVDVFRHSSFVVRHDAESVYLKGIGSRVTAGSARVVLWAEPERATGAQALRNLQRLLDPAGRMYVIVSQPLARRLPEWRGNNLPAAGPAGLRRTIDWLRQQGWTIAQLYGFHSPASIVWEAAARLMERAGRADLADRCHFKMRDTYVAGGAQAALAPVAVLAAVRDAAGGARSW
jgi:hypothetical protein